MIHFSDVWNRPSTFQFWFWLISLVFFVVTWPFVVIRRLDEIRFRRVWAIPILLPTVVLFTLLVERWPHILATAALVVSAAAPLPLVLFRGHRDSVKADRDEREASSQ